MATLDDITKEKERVGEALSRINAQHEKLVHQLQFGLTRDLEQLERQLHLLHFAERAFSDRFTKTLKSYRLQIEA